MFQRKETSIINHEELPKVCVYMYVILVSEYYSSYCM